MPTYYYEAMDQTGQEIKDVIEAASQEEVQATIKQNGWFVTKIAIKKSRKGAAAKKGGSKGKTFAIGGVNSRALTTFTRQLSILQDAGLPILRSLKILQQQATSGALKNSLMTSATRSKADRRSPRPWPSVPKRSTASTST